MLNPYHLHSTEIKDPEHAPAFPQFAAVSTCCLWQRRGQVAGVFSVYDASPGVGRWSTAGVFVLLSAGIDLTGFS